ncbi:hypothetical protein BCR42DRAFT_406232 [Absidia repens]|uniref:Uncharacterized protein n=1 Tax=Absidia repens TaxID=90262 RepID=A0A1X2IUK3_9FUNG|nr:hypothetical protein BCR42DRAFT_406232 [Absidia repens]
MTIVTSMIRYFYSGKVEILLCLFLGFGIKLNFKTIKPEVFTYGVMKKVKISNEQVHLIATMCR